MTLASNWMQVDLFTIDDAAALWCGVDPASLDQREERKPSEVFAAKQMFRSGVASGELRAEPKYNLDLIGELSGSMISRNSLERFARSRNCFPASLFDTLAPFDNSQTREHRTDLGLARNALPESQSKHPADGRWSTTGIASPWRSFGSPR